MNSRWSSEHPVGAFAVGVSPISLQTAQCRHHCPDFPAQQPPSENTRGLHGSTCVTKMCGHNILSKYRARLYLGDHSSAGKESACKAGDPSLIPGLGRSAGEGIGYPLQYSWAALVAQLVKNPPTTWETWVPFLSWKDPLEKAKATHSSILARRIPWTVQSMGLQRVKHNWETFTFNTFMEQDKECLPLNAFGIR